MEKDFISRILISREDANIDIAFNARLSIFNQYIFWQNNKILPKDILIFLKL